MYFDRVSYGTIFVLSPLSYCYMTSVSPEFGTTLAQCLNQSHVYKCRASVKPTAIKFGTAEAQHLNWALGICME